MCLFLTGKNIPIALFALITLSIFNIGLALTKTILKVALLRLARSIHCIFLDRTERIAIARVTLERAQRIAPIARQALLAPLTRRVVHTPQTPLHIRLSVTIAHRILVNISIALAFFASRREYSRAAHSMIAVVAQLAQVALRARRTSQTHHFDTIQLIVEYLGARSVVRTRTLLAHVGKLVLTQLMMTTMMMKMMIGNYWRDRIAVVAFLTLLAVVAARVMHARAPARVRVA